MSHAGVNVTSSVPIGSAVILNLSAGLNVVAGPFPAPTSILIGPVVKVTIGVIAIVAAPALVASIIKPACLNWVPNARF
jgi:hypothetical protein